MTREVENCQGLIRDNIKKPLKMCEGDEINFEKATHCDIGEKKYKPDDGPNGEPVRDHIHVTGKYRGSAHKKFNLKLRISAERIKVPVIFHNLKGYDSHFIIQNIGELINEGEPISIGVIPCNAEKYMR